MKAFHILIFALFAIAGCLTHAQTLILDGTFAPTSELTADFGDSVSIPANTLVRVSYPATTEFYLQTNLPTNMVLTPIDESLPMALPDTYQLRLFEHDTDDFAGFSVAMDQPGVMLFQGQIFGPSLDTIPSGFQPAVVRWNPAKNAYHTIWARSIVNNRARFMVDSPGLYYLVLVPTTTSWRVLYDEWMYLTLDQAQTYRFPNGFYFHTTANSTSKFRVSFNTEPFTVPGHQAAMLGGRRLFGQFYYVQFPIGGNYGMDLVAPYTTAQLQAAELQSPANIAWLKFDHQLGNWAFLPTTINTDQQRITTTAFRGNEFGLIVLRPFGQTVAAAAGAPVAIDLVGGGLVTLTPDAAANVVVSPIAVDPVTIPAGHQLVQFNDVQAFRIATGGVPIRQGRLLAPAMDDLPPGQAIRILRFDEASGRYLPYVTTPTTFFQNRTAFELLHEGTFVITTFTLADQSLLYVNYNTSFQAHANSIVYYDFPDGFAMWHFSDETNVFTVSRADQAFTTRARNASLRGHLGPMAVFNIHTTHTVSRNSWTRLVYNYDLAALEQDAIRPRGLRFMRFDEITGQWLVSTRVTWVNEDGTITRTFTPSAVDDNKLVHLKQTTPANRWITPDEFNQNVRGVNVNETWHEGEMRIDLGARTITTFTGHPHGQWALVHGADRAPAAMASFSLSMIAALAISALVMLHAF